jgi:hypothetical protein
MQRQHRDQMIPSGQPLTLYKVSFCRRWEILLLNAAERDLERRCQSDNQSLCPQSLKGGLGIFLWGDCCTPCPEVTCGLLLLVTPQRTLWGCCVGMHGAKQATGTSGCRHLLIYIFNVNVDIKQKKTDRGRSTKSCHCGAGCVRVRWRNLLGIAPGTQVPSSCTWTQVQYSHAVIFLMTNGLS